MVKLNEGRENVSAKPVGLVLFSVTISLPLDAAGREMNVSSG